MMNTTQKSPPHRVSKAKQSNFVRGLSHLLNLIGIEGGIIPYQYIYYNKTLARDGAPVIPIRF
jgi:hypothetical protein